MSQERGWLELWPFLKFIDLYVLSNITQDNISFKELDNQSFQKLKIKL
jgi:hypothetical protein